MTLFITRSISSAEALAYSTNAFRDFCCSEVICEAAVRANKQNASEKSVFMVNSSTKLQESSQLAIQSGPVQIAFSKYLVYEMLVEYSPANSLKGAVTCEL